MVPTRSPVAASLPSASLATRARRGGAYAIALAATLAAALLTWATAGAVPSPSLGRPPFPVFFMAAIMAAAWYGGRLPGMMALVASVTWLAYFQGVSMVAGMRAEPAYGLRLALAALLMTWLVMVMGRRKDLQADPQEKPADPAEAQAEQARAEEKLKLYREIFNSSRDAIAVIDREGRYMEQNPAHRALTGYNDEELRDRTPAVHLGETVFADIAQQLARSGYFRGEVVSTRKDGRHLDLDISAFTMRDSSGEVICHVGIKRDITERKKVETALVESESKFRAVAETAPCAIYIHDGTRLLFVNHAAEAITGYTRDELIAADMWSMVHPDHRAEVQRRAAARFRGEPVPARYEYKIVNRRGEERWLDFSAGMVKFGEKKCILATAFDVTERKNAEAALRVTEKLAATGRMAATIAHEINNPLESVTNLIYLLERYPGLDNTARDYARTAQEELGRVAHIARQTLGFYREPAEPVQVNTRELLETVLQLYRRKLLAENVAVEARLEIDGVVWGRPGELRQVFSNLIANALEAAGPQGRVTVHLYSAPSWKMGGGGICVAVADNGPGIPSHYRPQLFEPFFTTKGEKGTGLGLWVTQGIVHKHGGTIRVRSITTAGRSGTCFLVCLPQRMAEMASVALSA